MMKQPLVFIKLVHTLIWIVLAGATLYIFYSGISGRITTYTWIAIAMIIAEGIVLLLFKWACPLTVMARKYSDSDKDNFDIYLPNWLARHNKTIFTTIFLLGILFILIRKVPVN
ncbi:MAG: hypothetical protein IT262_22860 [Saprospiraceae bacterium]|nr:hypothetical protein [Saprospiraceae bacterium]